MQRQLLVVENDKNFVVPRLIKTSRESGKTPLKGSIQVS